MAAMANHCQDPASSPTDRPASPRDPAVAGESLRSVRESPPLQDLDPPPQRDLHPNPWPGDPTQPAATQPSRPPPRRRSKKGPTEGPDARIAPNEENAITRAIQNADKREGQAIFFPHKGMVFNSCEEARELYNLFSWEKGFGIRYGRVRRNKKDYRLRQDIVCSCEGFDKHDNSATMRTGCKSMITLLRTKDHAWYINKVCDMHNHPFSVSYAERKQWNSHGGIDAMTRDLVKKLRENNVSLGRICNILGTSEQTMTGPIRKESVRSLCAKLSQDNLRDDIGKTMTLLQQMKEKDPAMEVKFKVDSSGKIVSMLWCTGKNRLDYTNFGDAITFDTTYRTNLYSLPFGLFVGVNNHFQSIIFGGVLLTTEKTTDFEWAFSNFVDIMGGVAPKTILTDQCAAMAKAIKNKLPNTRHRWCRWHVLKNAKERFGAFYSRHKRFKRLFNDLITDEVNIEDFEQKWTALIKKYRLVKNKFLKRLFRYRERWAKPYFMGIFCVGMTSTQRSESANHMLKQYIQKAAPMHLFISRFNEFQTERHEQEGKEQHVTKMVRRKLRVGVPIERHAKTVYTRAMYEKFYDELFASGTYAIHARIDESEFHFVDTRDDDMEDRKVFKVTMNGGNSIHCGCGLYDHMGMLCRHALKVLVHLDSRAIPPGNIMKRWTKEATSSDMSHEKAISLHSQVDCVMKKMLMMKTMEVESGKYSLPASGILQAIEALAGSQQMKSGGSSSMRNHESITLGSGTVPTSCPDRTLKGGRPPSTGLKAWVASQKKTTDNKRSSEQTSTMDWPEEEDPPMKKKRRISDI